LLSNVVLLRILTHIYYRNQPLQGLPSKLKLLKLYFMLNVFEIFLKLDRFKERLYITLKQNNTEASNVKQRGFVASVWLNSLFNEPI